MTPGTVVLVRIVFWAAPLLLGYIAGRCWGRARPVLGLLVAAFVIGAAQKPFPAGLVLAVAGFLGGVPLGGPRR